MLRPLELWRLPSTHLIVALPARGVRHAKAWCHPRPVQDNEIRAVKWPVLHTVRAGSATAICIALNWLGSEPTFTSTGTRIAYAYLLVLRHFDSCALLAMPPCFTYVATAVIHCNVHGQASKDESTHG